MDTRSSIREKPVCFVFLCSFMCASGICRDVADENELPLFVSYRVVDGDRNLAKVWFPTHVLERNRPRHPGIEVDFCVVRSAENSIRAGTGDDGIRVRRIIICRSDQAVRTRSVKGHRAREKYAGSASIRVVDLRPGKKLRVASGK